MSADSCVQANPPERTARQEKERTPMELFIRHLIYDVLTKKTIDKVLKFIRMLDWNDEVVKSGSRHWAATGGLEIHLRGVVGKVDRIGENAREEDSR